MTWCEECDYSTLDLCKNNRCRRCCRQHCDETERQEVDHRD